MCLVVFHGVIDKRFGFNSVSVEGNRLALVRIGFC